MGKTAKIILVVEDNPVSQELLENVLKNDGYKVERAFSAVECRERLKRDDLPAAILMDVILPDGDGKKLAMELRSAPRLRKVPVVFITNTLPTPQDKGYEAFELNGEVFRAFAKPIHTRKLLSALRKEINRGIHGGKLPGKIRDEG